MDTPKTIGNVNFLDLTRATEASVATIKQINNINMVIYTPETYPLLARLNPGNVNGTLLVPTGASVVTQTGKMLVNAEFFKSAERPIYILVTGKLLVEPGVPADEVEKNLAGFAVTGHFLCPDDLMGAFNSKPNAVVGTMQAYPSLEHFFTGCLALDTDFLNNLADGAEISVVGGLEAAKVLPNDLIERKLGKLFVSGGVTCHAENAQAIRSRLFRSQPEFRVIPAGYEWVKKPLVLDADTLDILPGRKLYCKELVQVGPGVSAADLDGRVDGLIAEDLLIAPAALKPALASRCNLFETRAVFHPDELWLVQDDQMLDPARFERLQGTATLVVTGELAIDPGVAPSVLAAKLSKVHNLGAISCTPEQRAVLEERLGLREGHIAAGKEEAEEEEQPRPDFIPNVNHLAL